MDRKALTVKEAQVQIQNRLSEIEETEEVNLFQVGGRILATDIRAKQSSPPYPRSPFDGYAVRAEDIQNADRNCPVSLKVVEKIYAGDFSDREICTGEAARIMTGAPIPEGADTVVKQEDTDYGETEVAIYISQKAYDNYCPAGEDFKAGEILLKKGTYMDAIRTGIAAAAGYYHLCVFRKIRIAILTTGTELRCPGEGLSPGQIYDSIFYYLADRIRELGGEVIMAERLPDEETVIRNFFRKASACADLIVTTGGVSVGEKDLIRKILEKEGADMLVEKISVKPGSPSTVSVLDGKMIISLSGNPFAAAVHTELLVRSAISCLSGCGELFPKENRGVSGSDFEKYSRCDRYIRGKERDGKILFSVNKEKSGIFSSMNGCNCIVKIEKGREKVAEGEQVWYIRI